MYVSLGIVNYVPILQSHVKFLIKQTDAEQTKVNVKLEKVTLRAEDVFKRSKSVLHRQTLCSIRQVEINQDKSTTSISTRSGSVLYNRAHLLCSTNNRSHYLDMKTKVIVTALFSF